VDIVNGRIDITYGNNANPAISGKVLSLTPYESGDFNNVVWRCGDAPAPPNLRALGSAAGGHRAVYQTSTIPAPYQSAACAALTAIPGIPGDSPIRSQISEGLYLAAAAKVAVAEYAAQWGRAPANRTDVGLTANPTDTAGRFVTNIDVVNGRIDITYGNEANAAIAGKVLSLTPYEMGQAGPITWRCGHRPALDGMQPLGSASDGAVAVYQASTVDNQYLPADCRSF
jgi:type IV pilus assembly protein PilA